MYVQTYAYLNAIDCEFPTSQNVVITSKTGISFAQTMPVLNELAAAVKARWAVQGSELDVLTQGQACMHRVHRQKTWLPGKNLQRFIAAIFGIHPKEQQHMVQAISDAVADVGPLVHQAMAQHPGFVDIGKRMLMAWTEGVQGLRDQRVYAVGEWQVGEAFEGFAEPPKLKMATTHATQPAPS